MIFFFMLFEFFLYFMFNQNFNIEYIYGNYKNMMI